MELIVAVNKEGLIGIKDYGTFTLPWPLLREDLQFFRNKTITTNLPENQNAIIMGYNTYKSLPKHYFSNKKRFNIVIKRITNDTYNNITEAISLDHALEIINSRTNIDNIYIIGGATIYNLALRNKNLKRIHITFIDHTFPKEIDVEEKIYCNIDVNKLSMINSYSSYDSNVNIKYEFKTYDVPESYHEQVSFINNIKYQNINYEIFSEEMQYINLIKTIMENGIIKNTRNEITKSIFGYQLRYDLQKGYPLLTIKKSYPKTIFEELMWMIRGQTDVKILNSKGVNIWNKNSSQSFLKSRNLNYQEGDIGPGYGFQLRHYGAEYIDCKTNYEKQGIDQLQLCIDLINNDPFSRRILIDLWNPSDIDKMALPPCHLLYNFNVELYPELINGKKGKLNCHLFQRSWDVFLGWNTTTAALLTYMLANHCDLDAGILVHSITDAHLYKSHIDNGLIDELLRRKIRPSPKLYFINKHNKIEDYEFNDIVIVNYYPCPPIKADMVA